MEIRFDGVDGIKLAPAGCCEHGNMLSGSIKFLEFLEELGDCKRLALR
jgi:hypothetical protein